MDNIYENMAQIKYDKLDLKKLCLCYKLNFTIALSLQPHGVNLWDFALRLFDQTEFTVWKNIRFVAERFHS